MNNYNCDHCGDPCYIKPKKQAEQKNGFCSIGCYSNHRVASSANFNKRCLLCKDKYYSRSENSKYCTRQCSNKARTGIKYDGQRLGCNIVSLSKMREAIIARDGNKCLFCNIPPVWNNKNLTLQIDHISGNRKDNSLDNLRLLCPNCHSQTETWGRRKIKV